MWKNGSILRLDLAAHGHKALTLSRYSLKYTNFILTLNSELRTAQLPLINDKLFKLETSAVDKKEI